MPKRVQTISLSSVIVVSDLQISFHEEIKNTLWKRFSAFVH